MKIKIGIQGDIGSTNERACQFFAKKYKWHDYKIRYLILTENVLKALSEDKINYGTFAWKSSRSGLVQETQRAIRKYKYEKIDEENFQLDHALLCNAKINKDKIINIFSHIQALKEHKHFLEKEFDDIQLKSEVDTAIAAKKLKNNKYPANSIVIAPISCADIYGLNVYMDDLPTNQGYFTTIYLARKLL